MIGRHLSFFAPAAVMSAWGTVMLHTIANGHINRLLNPMFRSYVLIAGIALLLLSAAYVLLFQGAPNPGPALGPTGRLRQGLRWLFLLLPVLAASIFSPNALSSTTSMNRATLSSTAGAIPMPSMSAASQEDVQKAMSADPNQPVPVDVTDLITLSHSPDQMKAFAGRPVRAIGFIVQQPGSAPKLLRWLMWCCAADAQPVSVELGGSLPPAKEDEWYEIVGTAEFPSTLGRVVPRIDVQSVKPTSEPDEPYLSP